MVPTTCLPIFILGISQRSGTNYLHDLLALHPDCATRNPPTREDYLLRHSDKLLEYAQSLGQFWNAHWQIRDQEPVILAALGRGLMSLIAEANPDKRVLTKTPSVYNIEHFRGLFPEAPLLIIVRDGRAVAESAYLSFQRPYEYSARMWAYGVKIIKSFLDSENKKGRENHLVIRYEDLVRNVRGEMETVLNFLGLNTECYDFQAAVDLPVRGSSVHRGESQKVHWKPVPKTASFNPLNRFEHWSKSMHKQFNWIAGEELKIFGYVPEPEGTGWTNRLVYCGLEARFRLVSAAKRLWCSMLPGSTLLQ